MNALLETRVLAGFDDPSFPPGEWTKLLANGDTDSVNLTWQWQRNWWQHFGRGRLLLILAEQAGKPVALAPLFSDGGMVFNLCPEDQLDFLGDIGDGPVLDALLETARQAVPGFVGFRFYFVPDESRTGGRLKAAAARLGLECWDEGELPSPRLEVAGSAEALNSATRKKSLVRHENYFRREGRLTVSHLSDGEAILPHLPEFFEQHVARCEATSRRSLFCDAGQRRYYHEIACAIGPTGWLRFTRVEWNGRPIAFHFGLSYKRRYLLGIPSFDVELARRSPGEVLLRQILLEAMQEEARVFDFGIGGEAYKYRFANNESHLRTWGLYPGGSRWERSAV